jgi:predicted Fe-Mo cluster-binding NifX family protein
MKIVITANKADLNSEVDPRFGRAPFFLLVDTETGESIPIDNQQNLNAAGGAGIQAAEMMSSHGAEVLLTGHCGPNAFRALNAAGIKIIIGVEGTLKNTIEKFKNGEYKFAESADVEGHW